MAQGGRRHFVGIGGAGMSSLAAILLDQGEELDGCDRQPTHASTEYLRSRGVQILTGHDEAHLEHASSLVVTGPAMTTAEVLEARRRAPARAPSGGAARDSDGRAAWSCRGGHARQEHDDGPRRLDAYTLRLGPVGAGRRRPLGLELGRQGGRRRVVSRRGRRVRPLVPHAARRSSC
ncbi:MAG: Mur ligase domain-containing protein [Chloroflexia bacterium]